MTQQSVPPTAPPPPPPSGVAQLPKGAAIGGMVCGIISICTSCLPVAPLVLGILGIALGAIGIKKANLGIGGGKGMAITGLVCGIVGTVWGAVYTILYIAWGTFFLGVSEAMNEAMQEGGSM